MMIRNYTKQSRGFFIRVVAKIPMMTVLQLQLESDHRTSEIRTIFIQPTFFKGSILTVTS